MAPTIEELRSEIGGQRPQTFDQVYREHLVGDAQQELACAIPLQVIEDFPIAISCVGRGETEQAKKKIEDVEGSLQRVGLKIVEFNLKTEVEKNGSGEDHFYGRDRATSFLRSEAQWLVLTEEFIVVDKKVFFRGKPCLAQTAQMDVSFSCSDTIPALITFTPDRRDDSVRITRKRAYLLNGRELKGDFGEGLKAYMIAHDKNYKM